MRETYLGEVWCSKVSPEARDSIPTLTSLCCLKEEEGKVVINYEG